MVALGRAITLALSLSAMSALRVAILRMVPWWYELAKVASGYWPYTHQSDMTASGGCGCARARESGGPECAHSAAGAKMLVRRN